MDAQMAGRELSERVATFEADDGMLGNTALPVVLHNFSIRFRALSSRTGHFSLVQAQQRGIGALQERVGFVRRQMMHADLLGDKVFCHLD